MRDFRYPSPRGPKAGGPRSGWSARPAVEPREPHGRDAGDEEPPDHDPRENGARHPERPPAPRRRDHRPGQASRPEAALEPSSEVVVVHDRQLAKPAERLESAAPQPDRRVAVVDPESSLGPVPGAEYAREHVAAVEVD